VVNDYTGYIVNSELEYSQALEYLYNHPQERARLGRNAAEYARQIFGAEPAARKLNAVYEQLMNQPKRTRAPFGSRPPVWLPQTATGVQTFLDYLGPTRGYFEQSMRPSDRNAALEADALIMKVSHLMKRSGIKSYRNFYPTDPYLCFWSGLASLGEGNAVEAMHEIVESLKHGFTGWRPWWFLAQAAQQAGSSEIAKQALTHVLSEAGDFEAARELNAVL
jgi:predicted Zn-dependent protease